MLFPIADAPHFPHVARYVFQGLLDGGSARNQNLAERCKRDASRAPARLFAISDVHYDHPGAREWVGGLSTSEYRDDAIILAGDVGDTYTAVRLCLRAFRSRFRRVFYVPGNHDLWIRPKGQHSNEPAQFADSVAKLLALWQLCDELDVDVASRIPILAIMCHTPLSLVHTLRHDSDSPSRSGNQGPAQLSPRLAVLPLESWYSHSFDRHDPRPGSVRFDSWCKWPMGDEAASTFMLGINEPRLTMRLTGDIVSFSHFLPRQELPIPLVHQIVKACGCSALDEQIRRAGARMHVYGHTHINGDQELSSVRYVQNALGYGIQPGTRLYAVHAAGRFKR
jgi:predicted phosphodiesterase